MWKRIKRARAYWKPVMLGDLVESRLTAFGITKDRVSRWLRVTTGATSCGCEERRDLLNEWFLTVQWRVYHGRQWWQPWAVWAIKLLGRLS
jgi:hypothetical protein